MYYPLFLDISQSSCLIVGAGEVGLRKAKGLLEAGVKDLLILDIYEKSTSWDVYAKFTQLRFEQRSFMESDLDGKRLVFACTGQKELNASIAKLCEKRGVLCNCVDAPRKGNCIVPALAQCSCETSNLSERSQGSLMAALSTEGASPAWARVLREELEAWLKPHAPMTRFLGKLRPLVLALGQDTRHNTALFRALVHSSLRHHLAERNIIQSQLLLEELLPKSLHKHIAELLHDIF